MLDQLIYILRSAGIGCHYLRIFAAALFYADDVAILAPSLKGLQKLLNLCHTYCSDWDILLNGRKTKNIHFGSLNPPTYLLELGGERIRWEEKCKYLGITLKAGLTFGCCVQETVAKFYRALNAILRIDGRSDDAVMLRLLESHCIPILTYGIEVVHVRNRAERRSLCVAYNAVYRKLFGYTYRVNKHHI